MVDHVCDSPSNTIASGVDVSYWVTSLPWPQSPDRTVLAIAWTGVLIFDCVVFCLTSYKAFTMGSGIKLLNVIVRDGRSGLVSNTSHIWVHYPSQEPCTFRTCHSDSVCRR